MARVQTESQRHRHDSTPAFSLHAAKPTEYTNCSPSAVCYSGYGPFEQHKSCLVLHALVWLRLAGSLSSPPCSAFVHAGHPRSHLNIAWITLVQPVVLAPMGFQRWTHEAMLQCLHAAQAQVPFYAQKASLHVAPWAKAAVNVGCAIPVVACDPRQVSRRMQSQTIHQASTLAQSTGVARLPAYGCTGTWVKPRYATIAPHKTNQLLHQCGTMASKRTCHPSITFFPLPTLARYWLLSYTLMGSHSALTGSKAAGVGEAPDAFMGPRGVSCSKVRERGRRLRSEGPHRGAWM